VPLPDCFKVVLIRKGAVARYDEMSSGDGAGRKPGRERPLMMLSATCCSGDDVIACRQPPHQRPVVIIEQNLANLDQAITQYLGLGDIILVPNPYHGLHMIRMFEAENIEIMAVVGIHPARDMTLWAVTHRYP
tara:strand:- start:80 stop:478 length:399 start_codon:yes stop_codon:yes gene_type:complete